MKDKFRLRIAFLIVSSLTLIYSIPIKKVKDESQSVRKIRGYCGWYSNASKAHALAVNVSNHLNEVDGFYDELVVAVGLKIITQEYPPGSGLFEPFLIHDVQYYAALSPVIDTARDLGIPISVMASSLPTIFSGPGNATDGHPRSWFILDPSDPSFNMDRFIARSVELAVKNDWTGYNLDDEVAGAPRTDARDFTLWLEFVNRWANGLHAAGLTLTADIQGMSWINVSKQLLSQMLLSSNVDRWVTMDTYWGGLPSFYDNFDYYMSLLPASRLGFGLYPDGCTLGECQRPPLGLDDTTARVWALGAAGAEEAWVWVLPVANRDFFGPLLRWRRACAGCDAGNCWENGSCLGRLGKLGGALAAAADSGAATSPALGPRSANVMMSAARKT